MNPGLFSKEIRLVLAQAHEIAVDQGQTSVRPEHVLLSLLAQEGVAVAMADYHIDVAGLKQALAAGNTTRKASITPGKLLDPSPELEGLFRDLWQRAKAVLHHEVQLADLIGALMDEGSPNSVAKKLPAKGLKVKDLEKGLLENIPGKPGSETPSGQRNLRMYGKSLTEQARIGNLTPVVGRHKEVRRLMQVLCRREKNNPILIGPPGIGKSSIVHGLAQRIARGEVPSALKGTDIFLLDLGTMVAGAEFRGVLEERVKGLLGEIKNSRGRLIIFVDELPTIFRKGGGVSDLGAMLKPALASGELRLIAVTTPDEYRQYIEKDSALERRLQPIHIAEPTMDEAIPMLMGVKGRYETYHGLRIDPQAVRAAVTLSARFIQDRYLPDKALDLLDEAAAKVRIEWDGSPSELGNGAHASQANGKNGSQALLASGVMASRERLAWQEMVVAHGEDLGWTPAQATKAEASLEPFRTALARNEVDLASLEESGRLYKTDVDDEDVAEIVSSWTGIPLSKLMENERAKLLHMEDALHQRVVGQDDAIVAVSNAVRLARAGMKDPNRPVGSFLFLGPTGVGKTELCRALAEFLFDDESAMIRVDMSEYMDKHTVSRLIGAPPGYIGYEDSGQLTESLRRKPFSVVLFDEIEKAHPDIFNILLQIMDDGRLTDGHGRTVDFKNAIVTLTSNVGGHLYRESLGKDKAALHDKLMEELRAQFRPEFLNRVDAIVFFDLLAPQQIEDIVEIQIRLINRRLAGGGIRLEVDKAVKAHLAGEGYDVLQGARPLKRLIQHEVLEPLARQVLQGSLVAGDTVMISMAADKQTLEFNRVPGEGASHLGSRNGRPLLTAPDETLSAGGQPGGRL